VRRHDGLGGLGGLAYPVARGEGWAAARVARPSLLDGVEPGLDEHVWRPGRFGSGRDITVMVDLTRGANGVLRARLLDLAAGRSGMVYNRWLRADPGVPGGGQARRPRPGPLVRQRAARRPRGGVAVLDAFHVVKLGTPGDGRGPPPRPTRHPAPRGHRDDPLYKIAAYYATAPSTSPSGRSPAWTPR
jgi:transposase